MLSDEEKKQRNDILRERDELLKQFDAMTDKTTPEAKRVERRLLTLKATPLPEDGEAMAAQEGAYSSRLSRDRGHAGLSRGDYHAERKVIPRGVLFCHGNRPMRNRSANEPSSPVDLSWPSGSLIRKIRSPLV